MPRVRVRARRRGGAWCAGYERDLPGRGGGRRIFSSNHATSTNHRRRRLMDRRRAVLLHTPRTMRQPAVIVCLIVLVGPSVAGGADRQAARDAGVTPASGAKTGTDARRTRPRWDVACASDLATICKSEAQRGAGRPCLWAADERLSDACYDVIIRPTRAAELCMPDFNRFCRDKPVEGLAACLKEHSAELTDGCRAAHERRRRLPKPGQSPPGPRESSPGPSQK